MSNQVSIEVQHRDDAGKNESRRLRRQGMIPAVVYGGGREPESVSVDPRPIDAVLDSERGKNTLIHLKIGDRELKRFVLIREIQRHPVTDRIIHADFVRVEMDKKVEVAVPLATVGLPWGVKNEGGLLDLIHRTVAISVLPADIPEKITVDVSELHVGQHIAAGDLKLPEGMELAGAASETLITVLGKAKEEEEAVAAAPAEGEGEAEAAEAKPEAAAPAKKGEGKK